MKCSICSDILSCEEKYCGTCGTDVSEQYLKESQTGNGDQRPDANDACLQTKGTKSTKRFLLIGVIAALLLGGTGIGFWVWDISSEPYSFTASPNYSNEALSGDENGSETQPDDENGNETQFDDKNGSEILPADENSSETQLDDENDNDTLLEDEESENIQPPIANQNVDWRSGYTELMFEAIYYSGNIGYSLHDIDGNYPEYLSAFQLADLNFDGIPELLIFSGGYVAGIEEPMRIFTMPNDLEGIIKVFQDWGEPGSPTIDLYRNVYDNSLAYFITSENGDNDSKMGLIYKSDAMTIMDNSFQIASYVCEFSWSGRNSSYQLNGRTVSKVEHDRLRANVYSGYEKIEYEPIVLEDSYMLWDYSTDDLLSIVNEFIDSYSLVSPEPAPRRNWLNSMSEARQLLENEIGKEDGEVFNYHSYREVYQSKSYYVFYSNYRGYLFVAHDGTRILADRHSGRTITDVVVIWER